MSFALYLPRGIAVALSETLLSFVLGAAFENRPAQHTRTNLNLYSGHLAHTVHDNGTNFIQRIQIHFDTFHSLCRISFRYIIHDTTTDPGVRIVALEKVAHRAAFGLTRNCHAGPADLQTNSCECMCGRREKGAYHNIMQGIVKVCRKSRISNRRHKALIPVKQCRSPLPHTPVMPPPITFSPRRCAV